MKKRTMEFAFIFNKFIKKLAFVLGAILFLASNLQTKKFRPPSVPLGSPADRL
jgi:hypothetical protein